MKYAYLLVSRAGKSAFCNDLYSSQRKINVQGFSPRLNIIEPAALLSHTVVIYVIAVIIVVIVIEVFIVYIAVTGIIVEVDDALTLGFEKS